MNTGTEFCTGSISINLILIDPVICSLFVVLSTIHLVHYMFIICFYKTWTWGMELIQSQRLPVCWGRLWCSASGISDWTLFFAGRNPCFSGPRLGLSCQLCQQSACLQPRPVCTPFTQTQRHERKSNCRKVFLDMLPKPLPYLSRSTSSEQATTWHIVSL